MPCLAESIGSCSMGFAGGGRGRGERVGWVAGCQADQHPFDLDKGFWAEWSLFRVLPKKLAESFRGVATPYHYLKAGAVYPPSAPYLRCKC